MKSSRICSVRSLLAGMAMVLSLASCDQSDSTASAPTSVQLVGAGSTFAEPILNQWFKQYHAKNGDVIVEYEGIGSGGGIKQFIAGAVNFAVSDAAMSDEEMAQVEGGVALLPITAGAEVIAYNLPNVSELKLSRDAYAGIFLGKIKKWNDPAIASANPGVALPDMDIKVVHRVDNSGTTYVFTLHLSAISPEWKAGPGTGRKVVWPVGTGAKQSDGVADLIKQSPGSVGYIEHSFAVESSLSMAQLQNKAGKYVKCTPETALKALAEVEMPANLRAWVPDPAGDDSYPIVTYSWLVCHTQYADAAKGKAIKSVIDFGLTDGQKSSTELGYVPLPDGVVQKAKTVAEAIKAGA